jgi:signal transduction histidine kinase
VLAPILHRLCRDNEDLANRKGLTLRARRTGAIVMSDAILLEGILRNLINSARQALESFTGFDPSRRPLPGTVVVRRAVDLLWHSIEVRSTVGWGSCFSILAEVTGARSERKAEDSFAGGTQRRENEVLPP